MADKGGPRSPPARKSSRGAFEQGDNDNSNGAFPAGQPAAAATSPQDVAITMPVSPSAAAVPSTCDFVVPGQVPEGFAVVSSPPFEIAPQSLEGTPTGTAQQPAPGISAATSPSSRIKQRSLKNLRHSQRSPTSDASTAAGPTRSPEDVERANATGVRFHGQGGCGDDNPPPLHDGDAGPSLSGGPVTMSMFLGPHIGPRLTSRFHRTTVWRRAAHVLVSLALFAGMALVVVILLCVLISTAYIIYKIQAYAPLVVTGMSFYLFLALCICRTLLRTALRLVVWIWDTRGSDDNSIDGDSDAEQARSMDPHSTVGRRHRLLNARPQTLRHALFFLVAFPSRLIKLVINKFVDVIVDELYRRRIRREQAASSPLRSPTIGKTSAGEEEDVDPAEAANQLSPGTASHTVHGPDSTQSPLSPQGDTADSFGIVSRADTGVSEASSRNLLAEKRDLKERVRHTLYFLTLVIVLLIPCLVIAWIYGYYAIVSFLSVAFVLVSAVFVILVNVIARIRRTLKFLVMLWVQDESIGVERRRAMFVATAGQDGNIYAVDAICEQLLKTVTLVLILGLILVSSHDRMDVLIGMGGAALLLMLFRLRNTFRICCSRRGRKIKATPPPIPYDGKSLRVVAAVYITRFLTYTLGLSFLLYVDLSPTSGYNNSERVIDLLSSAMTLSLGGIVGLVVAFVALLWLKETAFAVTQVRGKIVAMVVAFCLIGLMALAVAMNMTMSGFASSAAAALTFLAFDLRDGRAFWSHTGNIAATRKYRSMRRSSVNAMITVMIFLCAIIVSVVLGFLIGTWRSNDAVPDPGEIQFLNSTQPVPLCLRRYDRFSLVDFTTLSGASYYKTQDLALQFAQKNPNLSDVQLNLNNLNDTSGVRYMEFRFANSPNVSVVSIRGTATVEDVLQDMQLWSTPILLESSSYFGTMIRLWPQALVARLVQFISSYVAFSNFVYYTPTETVVRQLMAQGRTIYLTGHSLGGGLAAIIGGRQGIPAVTVSAPGLGLSYLNFAVTLGALSRWPLNIIPFSDPVPKADIQVGEIVHVPCMSSVPSECHRWRNTLRMLISICNGTDQASQGIANIFDPAP